MFGRWPVKWLISFIFVTYTPAVVAQMTIVEEPQEHLGYINFIGNIEAQDGIKFRQTAQWLIARGNTIHEVTLCTMGGNVQEAMDIGNQIRTLGASTSGPNWFANEPQGEVQCWPYGAPAPLKKNTLTGQGNPNADCASACFLIWSSGVTRDGNYIGIHRFRFDPAMYGNLAPVEAKRLYETYTAQYKRFLAERDVPISIVEKAFATESTAMYYLNPD